MQVKPWCRSKLPSFQLLLHFTVCSFGFGSHVHFSLKDLSLGSNIGSLSIFINVNAIQFSQVTESPPNYLKSDFKSANNLWARESKDWTHWQDRRRQNCERKLHFCFQINMYTHWSKSRNTSYSTKSCGSDPELLFPLSLFMEIKILSQSFQMMEKDQWLWTSLSSLLEGCQVYSRQGMKLDAQVSNYRRLYSSPSQGQNTLYIRYCSN